MVSPGVTAPILRLTHTHTHTHTHTIRNMEKDLIFTFFLHQIAVPWKGILSWALFVSERTNG